MRRRDDAAGHLVTLIVGLAVFTGVVTFGLLYAVRSDPTQRVEALDADAKAANALAKLTATTGVPLDWESRAWAAGTALGLAASADEPYLLGQAKLARLRSADPPPLERLANFTGVDGWSVRIRVEPMLFAEPNGTVAGFSGSRLAYVSHRAGDVEESKSGVPDSLPAIQESAALRSLAFQYRSTTAGSDDHASVGDVHPDSQPDLARELAVRLAGFDSVTYETALGEQDPWKVAREGRTGSASWWSASASDRFLTTGAWKNTKFVPTLGAHSITVGAFDLAGLEDLAPTLELDHWFDAGPPAPAADEVAVYAACVANCTSGDDEVKVWASNADIGTKASPARDSIDLSAFDGGTVRVRLVYDRNSVVSDNLAGEGWFVSRVALAVDSSDDPPVRLRTVYENTLDYNVTSLDFLVVGTDVDHDAFQATDGIAAAAITDWVVAGGRLLVLGSASADDAWLRGTFTVAGESEAASSLVEGESDFTHPLVASPHVLRVKSFDWSAPSWSPSSDFTAVLVGEDGNERVPVLSVSRDPQRFAGGALLATARPGAHPDAAHARLALANWLGYLLRHDGHAEVGASVPTGVDYGHASTGVLARGSETGESWPARVSVFVWR